MFKKNDTVVCIDARFLPVDAEFFSSLPQQGQVYTIRGVTCSGTGVLLEEIVGSTHPRHGCEFALKARRFRKPHVQWNEREEVAHACAD